MVQMIGRWRKAMDKTYTVTEAREKLGAIVTEVVHTSQRATLTRHGKPLAAVISADDLALLDTIERYIDVDEAKAALAEYEADGGTDLAALKEELDL